MELNANIDKVRSNISSVIKMKGTEEEKSSIVKKNNSFFQSYDRLKVILTCYKLIRESTGFVLSNDAHKLMIDTISDVKTIFELENVTRPEAFKKNVDILERKIPDEWKIYISNMSVQVLDDISILRQVADNSDQISLKNSQTSIKKCIDSWPLSQEIIDDYNVACENLKDYRNRISFDDEVEAFLRKVSTKTATLEDLSPKVMDWIEKENFKSRIGLVIKA